MITVTIVCMVMSFLAAILWPTPGPSLTLFGVAVLMLAVKFLP